jgi:hypothetical protein
MRAVALIAAVSLFGCFPHNRKARMYSQIGEGALVVTGIVLESMVKTGADCDAMHTIASGNSTCHDKNAVLGGVGLGLMLVGALGFVATISTAAEDKPPTVQIKSADAAKEDHSKLSAPITKPAATPTTTTTPTPTPPAADDAKPAATPEPKPIDASGTR